MFQISRRDLIVSATAAAATLGLNGTTTFIGAAAAGPLTETGFVKFKVGDIEMTALFDGIFSFPPNDEFIKGVKAAEIAEALKAGGMSPAAIEIPLTILVANIGGKQVMFDSGTGGQLGPTSGLMSAKNFAAAGIDPAKIATILVTHFHPDHIFGMMAADTNAALFPNAEVVVPAAEMAYWTDAANIGKMPDQMKGLAGRASATLGTWKNVRKAEPDTEVVPGVRSVSTFGHTPGHTSYQLASGGKVLYILGDVSNIPALFLKHPDWQSQFDIQGDLAAATRHRMMDRVIAEGAMVAGYHYPFPGAGTVQKDGGGYAFVGAV